MKTGTDQPIGAQRPRGVLRVLEARRTAGHGAVTPETATAFVSADLWADLEAWMRDIQCSPRLSLAGYALVLDATLPPDTVRLTKNS